MPATEQTWRNQKQLHIWFGATSLLLLLATIWMMAADHYREWKVYQRAMRTIEKNLAAMRLRNEESAAKLNEQAAIETEIAQVQTGAVDADVLEPFREPLEAQGDDLDALVLEIDEAEDAQRASLRQALDEKLKAIVSATRDRENRALDERKFQAAKFDEARATHGLAIRDQRSAEEEKRLLQIADDEKQKLDELSLDYEAKSALRRRLQGVLAKMDEAEAVLEKKLQDAQAEHKRILTTLDEQNATYFTPSFPFLGKKMLELPVLDAFNSPLKIDNLWTKNLTIANGSFGQVRRFDRCTTCHQGMDTTMAGSAVQPAYPHEHEVHLLLTPQVASEANEGAETPSLESVCGIQLADRGLVQPDDVTVRYVQPGGAAATAIADPERMAAGEGSHQGLLGVQVGDVITHIDGNRIQSAGQVEQLLFDNVRPNKSYRVTLRRGLPHPYSSHPRLDLFVGSLSPHPKSVFGCTSCHDGQGSGTEFKWSSHTPNTPDESERWAREHGWFNNHFWIYPMAPERFAESTCLKCHHQITELAQSAKFPEPPAPKLMAGYELISDYGCYGCHEIQGFRGKESIGPDMRLEPNYFAAAAQIAADPQFAKLPSDPQQWAKTLILAPDRDDLRHQLVHFLRDDQKSSTPQLSAATHKLASVLDDIDAPGKMTKPGPSLRYVKSKLGPTFLYDWIYDPTHFRPNTRMPKFFGHVSHLVEGNDREITEQFEPIEIKGTIQYLLDYSQSFDQQPLPAEAKSADAAASRERGKLAFEVRGCAACHSHRDVPAGHAIQGPDLSNIGDKFAQADNPDPVRWLYSWLKSPQNYHPRTRMPDTKLEPYRQADGATVDPAYDIAQYLLASRQDWQPTAAARQASQLDATQRKALDGLVMEYLRKAYFQLEAEQFLQSGIPAERATGAETELVGKVSDEQKLRYVGRKTIAKYGCYGCHDIPGFEDAKPIGTPLHDWGRKDPSRLAFEHIAEFLDFEHTRADHGDHRDHGTHHAEDPHGTNQAVVDPHEAEQNEEFYHHKLHEHDRIGFLWQKLRAPRSYDYKTTANKDYNDRLRMPQFSFNDQQREAVATFVLGLVADPPATEFVYHPDPREEALIAGRQVIEKFNCTGCHIFDPERIDVEFAQDQIVAPLLQASYPFLKTPFDPAEIARSSTRDPRRGTWHATLVGMPALDDGTGRPLVWDEEGDTVPPEDLAGLDPQSLQYPFQLWQPTLIAGQVAEVSPSSVPIPASTIRRRYPAWGGDLTLQLLTRVVELEKQANPSAKGTEAWSWLPPPLIGQGSKVQPEWLYSFLLDPHPIRPATFMRMPRFNLTAAEASALVNYFAARDSAEYPYEFNARLRDSHLVTAQRDYANRLKQAKADERPGNGDNRLSHALNIVTDNTYCIKCHIVGDFDPPASDRGKAPDLAAVSDRLRPEYVLRWVANPAQILPYTSMPVNIPYSDSAPHLGGVSQKLYHGTSVEQLQGLVDLLMNYDVFARQQTLIAPLVKPVPAQQAGESPPANPQTSNTQAGGSEDKAGV